MVKMINMVTDNTDGKDDKLGHRDYNKLGDRGYRW